MVGRVEWLPKVSVCYVTSRFVYIVQVNGCSNLTKTCNMWKSLNGLPCESSVSDLSKSKVSVLCIPFQYDFWKVKLAFRNLWKSKVCLTYGRPWLLQLVEVQGLFNLWKAMASATCGSPRFV